MVTENPWAWLREVTSARIALGRVGHSLPTRELLAFQLAHARTRDAVHQALNLNSFASLHPLCLRSAAPDRTTYLRRPDLGRQLSPEAAARLSLGNWDAVVVIADGLSAIAVERHAIPVLHTLVPELDGWRIAPICVVEQGRVAIGDEIGERTDSAMALVLIGERPGLSSPDSLGAYLTWAPRAGRTDAERNCVSNIRLEGLKPEIAARRIAQLMRAARQHQLTGIGLTVDAKPSIEATSRPPAGESAST